MRLNVLFFIVAVFTLNSFVDAQNFDIDLARRINNNRTPAMDESMKIITNSITPVIVVTPIAMALVGMHSKDPDYKEKLTLFAGAISMTGVTTFMLKNIVDRKRPFAEYPNDITKLSSGGSGSFPSGHTSSAFATATTLSLAYPKWYVIAPSMTWASLVGYSRVYLGVHYPTDVLAGAILGTGSTWLTHVINKRLWKDYIEHKANPNNYNLIEAN